MALWDGDDDGLRRRLYYWRRRSVLCNLGGPLEGRNCHLLNGNAGAEDCQKAGSDLGNDPPLEVGNLLVDVLKLHFDARKTVIHLI